MTTEKTLTRYDFETMEEYLLYPHVSFTNGQIEQAKKYYRLLVRRGYYQKMLSVLNDTIGAIETMRFIMKVSKD